MGLLDDLERGLERAVNGAFARAFRSGVQPVEIAAALRKELDTRAAVVARDRVLVPHALTVHLAPADAERVAALGEELPRDLERLTREHASRQRYHFAGPLLIRFATDEALREGVLRIESGASDRVRWLPVLDLGAKRYPLAARTVIGRGEEADIVLDDTGASRQHAEVLWDGRTAQLRDLGSTNGTKIDGQKVAIAELPPESVVSIGRSRLVFRVLAEAVPDTPAGGRALGGRR